MTRNTLILITLIAVTVIGGTLAVVSVDKDAMIERLSGRMNAELTCREGQVGGAIGGPFELVNAQGETVTDTDVITDPTILYFGYTYCPDICPVDTARNVAAVEILEERGYVATPAFISIDPERDTPEVVGDFAANLHPRMIGLTGSPEQISAASKAYRTYYARAAGGTEDDYLVDHSTHSYLVMPGTGFVDFFRRDVSAQEMADRVQCFMDTAG